MNRPAFLASALLLLAATPVLAQPGYAPYLECAVSRGNFAILLRQSGYPDQEDLRKVENDANAYLRIATAVAGRPLQDELQAVTQRLQQRDEAVMKAEGAEGYLRHAAQEEVECVRRVEENRAELLKTLEKYEAGKTP